MVFGFFMDGTQMTVPVIMGVLGNNPKNAMAATTGDNRVTNKQPGSLAVSGYADRYKNISTGEKPSPPDGIWQFLDQVNPAAQQVPAKSNLISLD